MIAGRMKLRITLIEPLRQVNDFGEEATVWRDSCPVWAERVKYSASRSHEVGEHFSDYRSAWNIRYQHRVCNNWRMRDNDGMLHAIIAVEPNRDRGFNTLVCERLNE